VGHHNLEQENIATKPPSFLKDKPEEVLLVTGSCEFSPINTFAAASFFLIQLEAPFEQSGFVLVERQLA
jgi:hypothetical protein